MIDRPTQTPKRIAITGGTGFVGGAVARLLGALGHGVVVLSRKTGLSDAERIARAVDGCDAVAHCAGINFERGAETFDAVHVRGTANVVRACGLAGIGRLCHLSFLRARPGTGCAYHESKFAAEEIVRGSDLRWTIFKPGMIYGPGDRWVRHLARAFQAVPAFALVGIRDRRVRPALVDDVARAFADALLDGQYERETVALLGPEEMTMRECFERVASAAGARTWFFPLPAWWHRAFAACCEIASEDPLLSRAHARILAEGLSDPAGTTDEIAVTESAFTAEEIRRALPGPEEIELTDPTLT